MKDLQTVIRVSVVALFAVFGGCNAGLHSSTGAFVPQTAAHDAVPPPGTILRIPGAPAQPGAIAADGAGADWFSTCQNSVVSIANIDEGSHIYSAFFSGNGSSCGGSLALGRNKTAMWFTDPNDQQIGYIFLKSHAFRFLKIPTRNFTPVGIAAGADNAMWFTEVSSSGSYRGKIGRVDLSKNPYTITEYPLSYNGGKNAPDQIALGSDGALWFTDWYAGGVGRIDTSYNVTFYGVHYAEPIGITSGPDGALWFTDSSDDLVDRIDPTSHNVTKFRIKSGIPSLIVARNSELWFSEPSYAHVGCIGATSHTRRAYRYRKLQEPWGITVGADNALWITDPTTASVWRFAPPDPCGQAR
jgi:virginiamycin B lyase